MNNCGIAFGDDFIGGWSHIALPLRGNACDRRRWRKQGAGVGAAVDKPEH